MGLPMPSLLLPLLLLLVLTPLVRGDLQFEVDEEVAVGYIIGDLSKSSEVANMGPNLSFKVMYSSEAKHLIQVNELSGELSVATRLDREALCAEEPDKCGGGGFTHAVQVAALLKSADDLRLLNVQLLVRDINDNAPEFRAPTINVSISESEAVGRRVPLPRAVDPDAGVNGVQRYRISAAGEEGPKIGPFYLVESDDDDGGGGGLDGDSGTGRRAMLELREALDREALPSYELLLWAEDAGNPGRSGSVALTVVVVDANDNAPVFVDPPTRPVRVTEHSKAGTSVAQLRAEDADAGPNGAVAYSFHAKLTAPATQAAFRVDAATGLVTVGSAEKLDRETVPVHRLVVVARDGAPPYRSASVTVVVELNDDNDNAPVFEVISLKGDYQTDDTVKIAENLPAGTPLVLISVSDPDLGSSGTVDVRLDSPSGPGAAFELTGVGGSGGGAGSTSPAGAETGNPGMVQFLLKTTRMLDYEEAKKYNVSVLAVDRGTPKQSKLLKLNIIVVDVNDNAPVFQGPASMEGDVAVFEASLLENSPAGTVVLNLSATDADSGKNCIIEYMFDESMGGRDWAERFLLNVKTGLLTLGPKTLDREERPSYELFVEARDGGTPSRQARAVARITVLDVNDNAPKFVGVADSDDCVYEFSVQEELPVGADVGLVKTLDLDEGDNARVALSLVREAGPDWDSAAGGGGGHRYFTMAPDGLLRTREVLDREARDKYELSVSATDSGRPALSAACRVRVTVVDVNDNAPVISAPSTNDTWRHVRTFSLAGTLVGVSVRAADADAGDNGRPHYEIVGGNPKGVFRLDADSGDLSLARTVSGSDEGLHRLVVRVRDRGGAGGAGGGASRRVRASPGSLEAPAVLLHVFVNETAENVTLIEQLVAESMLQPLDVDVVNLGRHAGSGLAAWMIIVLVAAAGVALLALTFGLIAFFCRRRRKSGGRSGKKAAPGAGMMMMSSSSSSSSGQQLQSQQAGEFLIGGSKKTRRKQRTNKGAVAGIQMQPRGSVGERLAGSPESQPFMKRFRFSSSSSHGGGSSVYRTGFLAGPHGDPSPQPASTFKPDTPSFSTFVEAPVGRATGSGGRGGGGASRGSFANDVPRSNHRQRGDPYDDGYEHHMGGRPPLPTIQHQNRAHDRITPEGSVGGRDDQETGARLPDIARYPPPQFQDYADPVDADVGYDPHGYDPHDYSQGYDDQEDYNNQHDYSDQPEYSDHQHNYDNRHNYDDQPHQDYGEPAYAEADRDYAQETYRYDDYDRPQARTTRHVPTTEL